MKIEAIRIQNFRLFKDETIKLSDYNCFVGPNGTGKSTVIYALNLFFRDSWSSDSTSSLVAEDFHQKNTNDPVKITITFTELSEDAKTKLKHYIRQNKLVVTTVAKYDPNTESAIIKQYGERLVMSDFKEFFLKHDNKALVAELRIIYETIRKSYTELPKIQTKTGMYDALREYEENHPQLCTLVPSINQFYGFTKGRNLLEGYLQYVFIPAIKDAKEEQAESKNTAIGKLLQHTVRSEIDFSESLKNLKDKTKKDYQNIIDQQQDMLDTISEELTNQIQEWAHPNAKLELEWTQDPDRGVNIAEPFAEIVASEGQFEGNISRFGHGFKRSYLFALLQVLANIEAESQCTLILACEEPELYQHPPQAKYLSNILNKLSSKGNQVVICTHSSYFVQGDRLDGIRKFSVSNQGDTKVIGVDFTTLISRLMKIDVLKKNVTQFTLMSKLHQELQPHINEMFFTSNLILVEGLEDLAYIKTHLILTNKYTDYLRYGCHIVPCNKKSNLIKPYAVVRALEIPTFLMFDSDSNIEDPQIATMHIADNKALLTLNGGVPITPKIENTLISDDLIMWSTKLSDHFQKDYDTSQLAECTNLAMNSFEHIGGMKKNVVFISNLVELLYSKYGVSSTLEKACNAILSFSS